MSETAAIFRKLGTVVDAEIISQMRICFGCPGIGGLVMCSLVFDAMNRGFESPEEESIVGDLLQNLCKNHFNKAAKNQHNQRAKELFREMTKNFR